VLGALVVVEDGEEVVVTERGWGEDEHPAIVIRSVANATIAGTRALRSDIGPIMAQTGPG
jgi:hypothetical protein